MNWYDRVQYQEELINAALRCIVADRAKEHADKDASVEYAYDNLNNCARTLAQLLESEGE